MVCGNHWYDPYQGQNILHCSMMITLGDYGCVAHQKEVKCVSSIQGIQSMSRASNWEKN